MSFQKLIDNIERGLASDKKDYIPLDLGRLSRFISIRRSTYTLLGGGTGTGKTSFVDEKFVIAPYDFLKKHGDEYNIKLRYFYRSMERKKEFKLAKWVVNKIYRDHDIIIDPKEVLMFSENRLTDDKFTLIKSYLDYFEEMLDVVDIHDGQETPFGMHIPLEHYALRNGAFIKVIAKDKKVVMYDHSTEWKLVKTFTETLFELTRNGEKRYFEEVPYRNKIYKVYYGEPIYIPDDPNLVVIPLIDHIGKTRSQEGMDEREKINKVSENMSYLRDVFGMSPIIISQFNRSLGDIGRMKLFKGDLQPQLEDFESSARTQHDADLVLALFNPYRYKSYDADGKYKEYDIVEGTQGPMGENRFRTLSILKDSYGSDDITIPLKFLGEVGAFSVMPRADDFIALQQEYEKINAGF